jgi:hypothetical protein
MPAYYDWRTNTYRMMPQINYNNVGMNPAMLGVLGGMGGGMQSTAPSVDMNAVASSMPVQLMAKFVNSRGWGTPMPAQGMYDWRGNTIGGPANTPAQTPAQAQGGGDNMLNGRWAALAGLLGKR